MSSRTTTNLHVRTRDLRGRLMRLLADHYAVRLHGRPDAAAWRTIAAMIEARVIFLNNAKGRALLVVRGPALARIVRVAP